MQIKNLLTASIVPIMFLTACGSDNTTEDHVSESVAEETKNDSKNNDNKQVNNTPAGGLYVGYYNEDRVNNPEDPTAGAFVLNLPNDDSDFVGNMYFTYVGCQTENVGNVTGTKFGKTLEGNWGGQTDGIMQKGSYNLNYQPDTNSYRGIYNNDAGKNYVYVSSCIEYYVAGNGTVEMFPLNSNAPTDFIAKYANDTISWDYVDGSNSALIYVMDPDVAKNNTGNSVVWQTIVSGTDFEANSMELPRMTFVKGKKYVAVVAVFDDNSRERSAIANTEFTY